MNQYFPKPYERSDRNVKIQLHLYNYPPNSDLKNATEKLKIRC